MNWIPVKSSNIEMVAYDNKSHTLVIKFHHSGIYKYEDVPYTMVKEMLEADSAGKYFHDAIRDLFPYVKLEDPREDEHK